MTASPNSLRWRGLRAAVALLYHATIRAAIMVATVLVLAYFAINSPTVVARLAELASDALPGDIHLKGLRWGPDPSRITLRDLVITDPTGAPVLRLAEARCELAWLPPVLVAAQGKVPLSFWIDRLTLHGLDVWLEQSPTGSLRLVDALVAPDLPDEPTPPALPLRLALVEIGLEEGAVHYDVNGVAIQVDGLALRGAFDLDAAARQDPWHWSARDVQARKVQMTLSSLTATGLAQLPAAQTKIASASGDTSAVRAKGVRMLAAATSVDHADVTVRWQPELAVQVRHGTLRTASPREPFLAAMLGSLFDAEVRFDGEVDVDALARTTVRGQVRGGGRMAGFDVSELDGKLVVQSPTADGAVVHLEAEQLRLGVFGGRLALPTLTYHLPASGAQTVAGKAELEGISSAEALLAPGIGLAPALALPLAATLNGSCAFAVEVETSSPGGLRYEARTDLDLQLTRDPRASWLPAATPTLHLRGGVDVRQVPGPTPAEPASMRAAAGPPTLTVALRDVRAADRRSDVGPSPGGIWARLDGALLLGAASSVDLTGELSAAQVGPLLAGFGIAGVDGHIALLGLRVRGPLLSPEIRADVRARGLRAGGVRLDQLRTSLLLGGGALHLRKTDARLALGHVRGDISLELYRGDLLNIRRPITVAGRGIAVQDVDLRELLGGAGVRGVEGRARVDRLRFDTDLDQPVRHLRASGQVQVLGLAARAERLERFAAAVEVGHGKLVLRDMELLIPPWMDPSTGPLGHRSLVRAQATVALDGGAWSLDVTMPTLQFGQFGEVRRLGMPLRGSVEGRLVAEGSRRDLSVDGQLTRLTLRGLAWDTIQVGDATVAIDKRRGSPASLQSTAFFPGFALREGSALLFEGLVPVALSLALDAARFDPWQLLALAPMAGVRVWVEGPATFRLDFRPGQPVYAVEALLPPGGFEAEFESGFESLRNRLPAAVQVLPDRVVFDSTEVVVGGKPMELCGTFLYPDVARNVASQLQLYLAGHVDVPRMGALAESMAALELGFDIGEDAVVRADPKSRCLHGPLSRKGALRITGPLDGLRPQGSLVLTASRMTPRGYGKELQLLAGGRLEITADDTGRLRLRIPREAPLEARIDDGRFRLWGRSVLRGYDAEEVDFSLEGVDLAHTAPKEYSVLASPVLRFRGTQLLDGRQRAMVLSGDVVLTEGQYSKSFDTLGKLIGGARDRELASYETPLLERMPWLGEIAFDIALRGQSLEVLSRFPFGRSDLELGLDLRVRGTMAAPLLFGRVEVQPGSMLTYSLVHREFEVTEGSIDFDGAVDKAWMSLECRTEIPLEEDVSALVSPTASVGPNLANATGTQSKKVVVFVQVSGPLDDPRRLKIQLRSIPSYEAADIQALVLTGRLNTAGGTGVVGSRTSINVLTEDIAEAFSKLLLSAFVDSVTIGIPPTGGINAKVSTSLGKAIHLSGQVYRDGQGRRDSSANLSIRLGEYWSLEGLLRSQPASSTSDQNINVYEAKLRYRVPLSE